MTPALQQLVDIFMVAKPVWFLALGGCACLLVDAIFPKRVLPVYLTAIGALLIALLCTLMMWLDSTETQPIVAGLIFDRFTLFLLSLVLFIGVFTLFNAWEWLHTQVSLVAEFCSLILFSITGMAFLFGADHLIVAVIGLEMMSLSVYPLVGANRRNPQSNEAALKYFLMGGVASAILLYGIALFYGSFGTFALSELALQSAATGLVGLPHIALALLFVGIFFKLATVPFHFWAPDVYEGAPAPITGFMATAVKVAAFGFFLRVLFGLQVLSLPHMPKLLMVLAVLTIGISNLSALLQTNLKRMLAYSSVSHAGYLLLAIVAGFHAGVYDVTASATVIFYLLGYVFASIGAFAFLSLLIRDRFESVSLYDLRGLGFRHPALSLVFIIFLLSLMGMPITVGFVAKYQIISLLIDQGLLGLAIFAMLFSVVSAAYYLRPMVFLFFKGESDEDVAPNLPLTTLFVLAFSLFVVLGLGLLPQSYILLSQIIASTIH